MSTQFSTTRKLAAALIAFLLAAATTLAARNGAYLPITGPTPLRFEPVLARTFALSPVKSAELLVKKDDANPMIEPMQIQTNAAPVTPIASTTEPDMNAAPAPAPTTSLGEAIAPLPTAAYSPSGDGPLITPQILAEYFKPNPGATNAAGVSVFVPVPVGFTPPMAPPPAQSRATYKVQ